MGKLERAAGIEPASLAWKAKVLPLHNARSTEARPISKKNGGQARLCFLFGEKVKFLSISVQSMLKLPRRVETASFVELGSYRTYSAPSRLFKSTKKLVSLPAVEAKFRTNLFGLPKACTSVSECDSSVFRSSAGNSSSGRVDGRASSKSRNNSSGDESSSHSNSKLNTLLVFCDSGQM